ncbi:MAG: cation:proton antiporter [Marinobacter sp.]|nr:cation:proton antiporter [Marinobacter sp.]
MTEHSYLGLFDEFAIMLAVAVSIGFLAVRLRQPLIVAFIAVGIVLGPAALGLIEHSHAMELLAEFGIALLLFVVGLRLDLNLIRTMGPVSLATGLGQITFTSLFVFLICKGLGLQTVHALYIAAAMSFSSTIIIVKLLSDKREIDALHGRIAIGFLIVQDIMVVVAMIVITAFGTTGQDASLTGEIGAVFVKGLLLVILTGLMIRFVLPRLLIHVAGSSELLVLFAIAVAIGFAAFSDWIGFSKEVGAFLGGIALATTAYREAIGARLTSVRDFLLLFFFISLGAQLNLDTIGAQVPMAILLSAFVLIGNPLIVLTIMGIMGFRKRTGFLAGLAVAQISEFSLILAALGLAVGHISEETVGLITLVALITIATSTYLILYSHPLFERLAPLLRFFERKHPFQEERLESNVVTASPDVIVFGLGRFGHRLAAGLQASGLNVLAVDFDPLIIKNGNMLDLDAVYGDAEDPEFLLSLPIHKVQWVVSSIPEERINKTLAASLLSESYKGQLVATTHHQSRVEELKKAGFHLVLLPYLDAADQAVDRICHWSDSQEA